MNVFSSLTNRIFFATATLAVLLTSVAIYIVNRAVTAQAQSELARGLDEAAGLVNEYRRILFESLVRDARFIADTPRIKAAVDTHDPATVRPIVQEYAQQFVNADLFAMADNQGQVLARVGESEAPDAALKSVLLRGRTTTTETEAFWPEPRGILLVKAVPIWIDPVQPDVMGTLILGARLGIKEAANFKQLTNSEIAFGLNGEVRIATLPESTWPALAPLLAKQGTTAQVVLNGDDYLGSAVALGPAGSSGQPMAIVLRSQTERLLFLRQLHTELALTAFVAVLAATLLSYAIARTVTRPVGAITSTMREMAASGDLSRRIPPPDGRWQDEDARLLATTFNAMTDSIERFQREANQRERLSSLGRLSTVIAHEIRNPLMIIKTSLRALRRDEATAAQVQDAAKDIDEEITRLNRIVSEVLDFARPIRFELDAADAGALIEEAVRAAAATSPHVQVSVHLDPAIGPVTTDAGRLRQALLNIIGNATQAVEAHPRHDGAPIRVLTSRLDRQRFEIVVSDRGAGIAPEDLPRIFDPFFTTRRTGTGIGLAISRNIIEGLGGRISVASTRDRGTDVRIELPLDSRRA
ncbi:MAG TPA: ATP-binding protein [Vicinamibacterales bacterium]|jgi:signal transduction histidine kinase